MLLELGGKLVGYFFLNYYEKYPVVCGGYEFFKLVCTYMWYLPREPEII